MRVLTYTCRKRKKDGTKEEVNKEDKVGKERKNRSDYLKISLKFKCLFNPSFKSQEYIGKRVGVGMSKGKIIVEHNHTM